MIQIYVNESAHCKEDIVLFKEKLSTLSDIAILDSYPEMLPILHPTILIAELSLPSISFSGKFNPAIQDKYLRAVLYIKDSVAVVSEFVTIARKHPCVSLVRYNTTLVDMVPGIESLISYLLFIKNKNPTEM